MHKDLMLAEIFSDVEELNETIKEKIKNHTRKKIIKINSRDTISVVAALHSLDVLPVGDITDIQHLAQKKSLHTMADNVSSQIEGLRRHI